MSKTAKAQLLRSTLLAALSVAPGFIASAYAQNGPAPAAAEGERDVVVITGSRIARQDYIANSPIVTVGQEDIAATGVTTLDTLLNEMPQFVPAISQTSNNPSNGGQANISLRGLGTNRTLILMNGRRVVPANSDGTVDINVIPSQLVKNIEVVTGGASSTYGSDAIAGVVNFILRDDFKGLEANLTYGITDESDGEQFSMSLAAGGAFDEGRGHAMMMVSYNDRDAIYNGDRPFSAISGASGTSPLGSTTFDSNNLPSQAAINAIIPQPSGSTCTPPTVQTTCYVPGDQFGFNNNGTLFDYRNRTDFVSPGGITYDGFAQPGPFFNSDFAFNTGALNLNVLPQKRYNAFASAEYDINDHAKVYTDFLFTQYESASELAASPAATSTGFRVPVSNPFIPAELRAVLATRTLPLGSFLLNKRFTSLGARRSDELYDVYQITTGVKGDIGFGDWTYDAYASYGRTDRTSIQTGNVSRSAVQQLLNATDGGASLCAGGFNWFGDVPLSDACKSFVGRTAKNLVTVEQTNVEISTQGGLFDLPAGQVRAAVGVDYREDNYRRVPDGSLTGSITVQPCIATAAYNGTAGSGVCAGSASSATAATGNPTIGGNDIAGFNPSAPLAGAIDSKEAFAEVLVPVLKDLPLIKELNFTVGGRVADYSTVGNISTYKVDFDWTVIDTVRLRGGYQSAVRAPAIGELFAPVLLGFPSIGSPTSGGNPAFSGDPCDVRSKYRSTSGSNLAASSNAGVRALCIAQGVSTSSVDTYTFTNQQVSALTGGNPSLTEESAKTYSIGVVWSPKFDNPWLANLTGSIDYYHIELQDVVGTVDANTALQQCYYANG
ncbi:MAG TPA: TonB-dependent receptor, partial [Hyphomonadaceae bacterium]|nr:TonB-dependent receptor [Hyphomonadaceae bacterium]